MTRLVLSCGTRANRHPSNDLLSDLGLALTREDHELCDTLGQPTPEEISVNRLAWEDLAA